MPTGSFWKSRPILLSSLSSFFLNVLIWLLLIFKTVVPEQNAILHYNVSTGVDWFGPTWHTLFLPAVGLVFFVLNTMISHWQWKHNPTASVIIMGTTIFLQLIILGAAIIVTLVNLSS